MHSRPSIERLGAIVGLLSLQVALSACDPLGLQKDEPGSEDGGEGWEDLADQETGDGSGDVGDVGEVGDTAVDTQDSANDPESGQASDSSDPDDLPETLDPFDPQAVELDFSCLSIDNIVGPEIHPPAGLSVKFRVTDCDGDPAPRLTASEFEVINDEKGTVFGEGLEGDSVSGLAAPTDFVLYSVLALDFSDSIAATGHTDDVIDGALAYLEQIEVAELAGFRHEVALLAFGRPGATEFVNGFTANRELLRTQLESLRTAPSRGSTDLYGAYATGLEALEEIDRIDAMSERFLVLITDGTHEAGDEEGMRTLALAAKSASKANIYAIGVEGAYDEGRVQELASTENNFFSVDNFAELGAAFRRIANRAALIANSNYVVGVCTPLTLGTPTLTINITLPDAQQNPVRTSITLPYDVTDLTGDIVACSANDIAGIDPPIPENDGIGCSDGTREGFQDSEVYTRIAGCSGGWQVPGVLEATTPQCDRAAGNDSEQPDGENCGVADLCAEGWHICASATEVEASSPTGCEGSVTDSALLFFASRQSGPGYAHCRDTGANDLFGCGSRGQKPFGTGCGVLDRFSHDLCSQLGAPWACGTDGEREAVNVVKPSSLGGGVLCCAD